MLSKPRIIVGCILCLIIIVVLILAFTNKDEWFKNEVVIHYPDRCIEKYVNQKLITNECTAGRKLMDEQQKEKTKLSQLITPNLSLLNLT